MISALEPRPRRITELDDVLAVGRAVLDVCFSGNPSAFVSKSPNSPSLRALMEDPRIAALGIGRRTIADYVRVYVQSLDFPEEAHSLDFSQRQKLLSLSKADQHEVAIQAAAAGWSAREVEREVRRRRGPGRGPGARQQAQKQALKAAKALDQVRLADVPDRALKALAVRVAQVVTDLVAEAERRGLELGVALAKSTGARSAPPLAALPRRRQRHQDGPLVDAYRPRSFDEVVGQDRAVEELRLLARVRSPLPVLLYGPSGTGKTTLARLYCRAWLCRGDRPDGSEACDTCDTCERTAGTAHHAFEGGIMEASAAATGDPRKAAEDVLEDLALPWDGVIVNEADRLLIQQQRLLAWIENLKMPVVFSTTDLDKFDTQFKGRCATIEVTPIPEAEMVQFLEEVADAEGVQVDVAELRAFLHELGPQRSGQVRDVLVAFETVLERRRSGSRMRP
ncbi:MAG: hypothetical protein AMXMBFR64_39550 [Myxococcales bacterium]